MDLILQSKRKGYNAKAKYDVEKKEICSFKGIYSFCGCSAE